MGILHQHQQSPTSKGSPKCDVWDGLVWRCFTGTININNPPFMSIPGALAFSIYVDWFNAHGKSTRLARIGPIMLIYLNFPPSERLKPENVYVAAIIPGPKEPTALQLNYLLMLLIKGLKELWQDYHFLPNSTCPSGSFICVAILTAVADVAAMRHQQMSLDGHSSPNTKRKMGQAEELPNELTKNTFHLISAINIATSWTVLMDDMTAFAEHWNKFGLSNQHLFPKQKSKPNHHFSDHIPELFQLWGPAQALATWVYEHLIGVFAKIPTDNKICTLINKIDIFTLIKHMN
ncbi:hypothetical protein O181_031677 [Austropuccinia psidii MF-1]|uniref:Uncharacterized protein n=1 Tax=Austropuccinia psidii MF-1 TaxID=1389203 RepID=A0A9Q3CY33_9BASI|nr:hypothetical protein [Austropuccinia psidii MF-1]